jgi:hypothetical protein
MRYQLTQHGWPISDRLIPVGTVIDDVAGQDDFSKLVRARGLSPPINAQPLDQATYNSMKQFHGPDMVRWIRTVPGADGIVR